MIDHDNLEEFRDPEAYDLECEPYDEDRPFIGQWARSQGGPLLDLACGTGRMALRMAAQGYSVTGVDIVPEMIARARQKAAERSLSVEWIVADGRTFQLGKRFPCIYMLMNAFQFFLTRDDQEAMLARVHEHLRSDGCFIFTTRQPLPSLFTSPDSESHQYTYEPTADGRQLVITETEYYDSIAQIQHFTTHYKWHHSDGQHTERTVRTALRYFFPQEMEALLFYNGFEIHALYGSWQCEPLTAASRSMIYVCHKRA